MTQQEIYNLQELWLSSDIESQQLGYGILCEKEEEVKKLINEINLTQYQKNKLYWGYSMYLMSKNDKLMNKYKWNYKITKKLKEMGVEIEYSFRFNNWNKGKGLLQQINI